MREVIAVLNTHEPSGQEATTRFSLAGTTAFVLFVTFVVHWNTRPIPGRRSVFLWLSVYLVVGNKSRPRYEALNDPIEVSCLRAFVVAFWNVAMMSV
jgi:hypothetical protein